MKAVGENALPQWTSVILTSLLLYCDVLHEETATGYSLFPLHVQQCGRKTPCATALKEKLQNNQYIALKTWLFATNTFLLAKIKTGKCLNKIRRNKSVFQQEGNCIALLFLIQTSLQITLV